LFYDKSILTFYHFVYKVSTILATSLLGIPFIPEDAVYRTLAFPLSPLRNSHIYAILTQARTRNFRRFVICDCENENEIVTVIDLSVVTGDGYGHSTVKRCNDERSSEFTDFSLYFDFCL
jgi:hypothetical protein